MMPGDDLVQQGDGLPVPSLLVEPKGLVAQIIDRFRRCKRIARQGKQNRQATALRSGDARSALFDVTMMLGPLVYGYCVGIRSSRRIAAACELNLAFRAIISDDSPDFGTLADLREIHYH